MTEEIKSYEEAVARKNELKEKINQYNEALFNEQELPFSEEEIDDMMAEYQYLEDELALTEEEKIERLEADEKEVLEDGTVVKVDSVFDKLHFTFYIYAIYTLVIVLFSCVFSLQIGNNISSKLLEANFQKVYEETNNPLIMFQDSSYIMGEGAYWFKVLFGFLIVPLSLLILSIICFILTFKMNKFNRRAFLIVLLIHVAVTVIGLLLIFFIRLYKSASEYYDNIAYYYFAYSYYS